MKKKMSLLAVLLMAVAVTAYSVSGTYAKYTSTSTSTDSARVAKWGFSGSSFTELDLFDGSYTNVLSGNTDNVLAPGTEKSQTIEFSYAGSTTAPEVAYKIDIELTGTIDSTLDSKLIWSLNDTQVGTFDDLKTAVAALSQSSVNAGTFPDVDDIKIGWAWPFAATDADESDTNLGTAGTASVDVTLTITATQID